MKKTVDSVMWVWYDNQVWITQTSKQSIHSHLTAIGLVSVHIFFETGFFCVGLDFLVDSYAIHFFNVLSSDGGQDH